MKNQLISNKEILPVKIETIWIFVMTTILYLLLSSFIPLPNQESDIKKHHADLFKSTHETTSLCDSILEELYNTSINEYEKSRMIRYTYSTDGLKSQKFYDDVNDVNDFKLEYTYDTAGILVFTLCSVWDTATHQWREDQKDENIFDADGNVIRRVEYYWNEYDSLWRNWRMYEYTYDPHGNVLQALFKIWDESKGQWRNYDKTDYTRDENGNMTSYIWQQWNKSNDQWYDAFSMEYTYDAEGHETEYIQYIKDTLAGQWINHHKRVTTWSAEGFKLIESERMWDTTSDKWIFYEKTEYSYDSHGNPSLEMAYKWDNESGQWVGYYRLTYYYANSGSTEINIPGTAALRVYPNPTMDYIQFSTGHLARTYIIDLFDIHGKKVLSQSMNGNDKIYVGNLNSGVYLYVIHGRETYSGKVVVGRQGE